MRVIIECPYCRDELEIAEAALGKRVKCPICSETFTARSDARDGGDREYAPRSYEGSRRRWRRDLKPHRGSTILTLGILSLVFAGFILGPIAWIMGNNDLAEMREGIMDAEGESNTNTGRILGMVATILYLVALGIALLLFLFVFSLAQQHVR